MIQGVHGVEHYYVKPDITSIAKAFEVGAASEQPLSLQLLK
jgi:acetylornithine/succinyldiaminopimelate/putrescine aminotransferase